jgi:hypothetical protein
MEQVVAYGSATLPEIVVEQPAGSLLEDGVRSVDFGSRNKFSSSESQVFTIRNEGQGVLSGLALSLDGGDAADFALGSLGATSLAPGESTTFTVVFTPSGGGVRRAVLQVASSDADESPFDISLSGTGIEQVASFDPNANSLVYAAAMQPDGKMVVSGSFTTLDGVTRNRVARFNALGTMDYNFNPDVNSDVRCIVVQPDGKVLIAGAFTVVGGVTRHRIARLNPDGHGL